MTRIREGSLLIAVIGEEDLVTGLLLTGMGKNEGSKNTNYVIVNNNTSKEVIEEAFTKFTTRQDIGILIMTQWVAEMIRDKVQAYNRSVPALLEVPGKTIKYDASKDPILFRAQRLTAVHSER